MLSKSIKLALLLLYVDVRSDQFFHPFLEYLFWNSVKILKYIIEMHKWKQ